MIAERSAAARRQGIKNALVVGTFCVAASCLASLAFAVVLGRPWGESMLLGLVSVAGTIYLRGLWGWLRGRRQAGGVLLDCGPHPARRSILVSASWLFVIGVMLNLTSFSFRGVIDNLGWLLSFHAIVMALMALGRFQLREHGFWSGMDLLPWDKIESYWWEDGRTLMLTTKGRRWLFKTGALLVRPEDREVVDRLFSTLAPTARSR